jgi:hypothetical protein
MGFGLVIGFIEHVHTQLVTANTDSHTLQFTTACTKSSKPAVSSPVFW